MKLSDLPSALAALEAQSRLRVPDDRGARADLRTRFGEDFLDASTNDYLGLGAAGSVDGRTEGSDSLGPPHPADVSRETAPGAGASRLVFGTHPEHLAIEKEVASWTRMPSALLFSSGYAANVGALAALLSPDDAVFSDALNHASLIDGIRLSRAKPEVFPHLDLGALEAGLLRARGAPARWVVVEAYYSMDGDSPDLGHLRALCDAHDAALYVDEAHSLGVFGPEGAGLCAGSGVRADVLVAAFGKAVGSQGACVLGSPDVRTWLYNRARSFVFSTAPSPVASQSLLAQIRRARVADAERSRLAEIGRSFRARLAEAGVPAAPASHGPIVSLVAGSESAALSLAARLRERGILVQAIRPPTVPEGASRVRLTLRATLTDAQVLGLAEIVARETMRGEGHA